MLKKRGGETVSQSEQKTNDDRIQALRMKIQDEEYIHAAIQRIALVMSNEISKKGGGRDERKEW